MSTQADTSSQREVWPRVYSQACVKSFSCNAIKSLSICISCGRHGLIPPKHEQELHDYLASIATDYKCQVIAINGMPDHVHLLVKLPATLAVSVLVQHLKGSSSHFANQRLNFEATLKWRGSYAAFSVSRWDVSKVAAYIQRQKEHHAANTLITQLEADE